MLFRVPTGNEADETEAPRPGRSLWLYHGSDIMKSSVFRFFIWYLISELPMLISISISIGVEYQPLRLGWTAHVVD